jgi:L-fuculose-phosphate aldolase
VQERELRVAVSEYGRKVLAHRLVHLTDGNVSARRPGGSRVAITPSSIEYDQIAPADVVLIDLDCNVVEGLHVPSSEAPMHTAVYQARPDVGAIVHTHSGWATVYAVLGEDIPAVHYEIVSVGNRVRCAPYATFGTRRLAEQAVKTLGGDNAILLANHGVLAVGTDLADAFRNAVRVEFLAQTHWHASRAGTPRIVGDEELDRVRAQIAAKATGRSIDDPAGR